MCYALQQSAVVAFEHLGCLAVALQLPVEPSQRGDGELAAVGTGIRVRSLRVPMPQSPVPVTVILLKGQVPP